MSNYATKSDLKSAIGVNTSKFAKNTDLVSLKSGVDKIDTGKLKTTPAHLSKLSNYWKMILLKRLYMIN